MLEFVEAMDLQRVKPAVQDWGGLPGLTLPMAAPARYAGPLVMNTHLATAECAATDADRRRWPLLHAHGEQIAAEALRQMS